MDAETETMCLSVVEAARQIRVSKSLLFNLIKADRFPHVHIGEKRVVVPVAALKKYLIDQNYRSEISLNKKSRAI